MTNHLSKEGQECGVELEIDRNDGRKPHICEFCPIFLPNLPKIVPWQRHFHIRRTRGNR